MKTKLVTEMKGYLIAAILVFSMLAVLAPALPSVPALLDPTGIQKYVNQLTGPPPVYIPRVIRGRGGQTARHDYTIQMLSFKQ